MDYVPKPERNGDQQSVGASRTNVARARQSMEHQDKSKPEKPSLSYADFHHEITNNTKHVPRNFPVDPRKQRIAGKEGDEDELVKYMSKLPSYLQRGGTLQEKVLNVGVLDWGLLEKWKLRNKPLPCQNSRYSHSSSNTSSSFSTDGSSTHSSRGHSSSPTRQRAGRSSFQSHLTASRTEDSHQTVGSSGVSARNFQDIETTQTQRHVLNAPRNFVAAAPALSKKHPVDKSEECKKRASELKSEKGPVTRSETQAVEGTTREEKIQKPGLVNPQHSDPKESKKIVLLLPRGVPESNNPVEPQDSNLAALPGPKTKVPDKSFSRGCNKTFHDGHSSDFQHPCPLPSGCIREESRAKQPSSTDSVPQPRKIGPNPCRERNFEEKVSTFVPTCSTSNEQSKALEQKPKKVMADKVRSISPFYRFSNGASKMSRSSSPDIRNPRSTGVSAKATTGSHRPSTCDASIGRARSSPLRRLLDPLLKPKAETSHHFVEPLERVSTSTDKACKSGDEQHVSVATRSAKVKLGMTGCKKISVNEFAMGKKHSPSTMQALLRVAAKNGLPLYTFAVNNESNILAATMKKLNAEKTDGFSCIYTFFTIQDVKKKSGSWISQGGKAKGNGHDYISNVVAQMKVSDSGASHLSNKFGVREFVLFSVDLRQADDQTSEFQPNNELAAIAVKLPMKTDPSTIKDGPAKTISRADVPCQPSFSTTVILPSAVHSLPSKGGPSSLIERWVTGGSCDCGGWDLGCKLQILSNPNQAHKKSSSSKSNPTADRLELFPQGGAQESQRVFSLAPFKQGTYSVEFHSSLSVLQAFSICTAVLDSMKQCQLLESSNSEVEERNLGETSDPSKTEAEVSRYVSYPPHSPVGRV